MLILCLLGMYFDAALLFVTSQTLLFRLSLAILCCMPGILNSWKQTAVFMETFLKIRRRLWTNPNKVVAATICVVTF